MDSELLEIAYFDFAESGALRSAEALRRAGFDVRVRSLGAPGLNAGLEEYASEAVVFVLTKIPEWCLDALGTAAISKITRVLAHEVKAALGVALARGDEPHQFSRSSSLMVRLTDDWRLKVLLRDEYDEPKLGIILNHLFDLLGQVSRGEAAALFERVSRQMCSGGMIIVRFDEAQDALILVDPVAEAIQRQAERRLRQQS